MDEKRGSSDDYEMLEQLGKGSYGTVWKARDKKTSQIVALKALDIGEDWLLQLAEINMVIDLRHETVVNYYNWFFENSKLWLVMECCDGGSLTDIMHLLKRPLNELEAAAVMRGLVDSVVYIHSLKRIHRDIKAGNILLTSVGQVKVCDFGVSAQLDDQRQRTGTMVGSPYWIAPEIISSQSTGLGYDHKVDIWSMGITALELLLINPPRSEMPAMALIMKLPSLEPPEPPKNSSPLFGDFCKKMLVKDPSARPNATDLVDHPFLKTVTAAKAAEILENLVREYKEKKAADKDGEAEDAEEEEEVGYEEEDNDELNLSEKDTSTILYGDGTFIQDATYTSDTMITSGTMISSQAPPPPQFVNMEIKYADQPAPSQTKLQSAQKRHFSHFNEKQLRYMLGSVKEIANKDLREGKLSAAAVRQNYEDVRKSIVSELQKKCKDSSINDDYESLA